MRTIAGARIGRQSFKSRAGGSVDGSRRVARMRKLRAVLGTARLGAAMSAVLRTVAGTSLTFFRDFLSETRVACARPVVQCPVL